MKVDFNMLIFTLMGAFVDMFYRISTPVRVKFVKILLTCMHMIPYLYLLIAKYFGSNAS